VSLSVDLDEINGPRDIWFQAPAAKGLPVAGN
jgi:hypothetical protein